VRRQTILGRGHGERWADRLRELGILRPLVAEPGTVVRVSDPLHEARNRLAASLGAGGELLGYVWVVEGDRPFTDADLEALRGTLPLAALHVLRHRSAIDVSRRERGQLLRQALLGEAPPESLGLQGNCVVAAFRLFVEDEAALSAKRAKAVDLIALASESFRRQVLCTWVDETAYALFPAVEPSSLERLVALCASTAEQARSTLGVPVAVGVGAVHPVSELRRSREEADRTARVLGREGAAHVDDLRVETALLAAVDLLHDKTEVRLPQLEDLAELDRRTGSDLVATLRALARSGGSITATARLLQVHANTVRYRLARIAETTGLDLDDPDTLFAVSLHLRVTEPA
jgi:hypothetical protein